MRSSLLLPLTLLAFACGGDPPTFRTVQTEVLDKSCNAFNTCHKGASPAGELGLEDPAYDVLFKEAISAPGRKLVVAGDPDGSFLMDKLLDRNVPAPGTEMPPGAMIEA